ncbi:MAG: aldehyde dehydrogenase family protein [Alphaproteobacteria bacterium]|nr:aldehyde dehydrogenase family protein [Alphaproteobacteria bacterium]NCQ87625.1 aldehyde dehydrogenase family protein [Alphaproteobacteria bacterium]NCT05866.1 aldehyde dehydrogenase family protein [Alphaproteobacteria bacterium]
MSDYHSILSKNGLNGSGDGDLDVYTPIDGSKIASVKQHKVSDVGSIVQSAVTAFHAWKKTPAPVRGELVRLLGEELRHAKSDLGALVTLECGKIVSEGLGEVQEMIDICDFAVGQSRQLYGLTIASERPGHHMREMWQPLGPVAVISAFNFPVAVWSWNAALALICGDPVIWKPSEKTPLTAMSCMTIFDRAVKRFKAVGHDCPDHLCQLLIGQADVGQALTNHKDIPLVSATGSTRMGRAVGEAVAKRMGKSLLELGGNNAMIVSASADLDMTVRAILFSAVGTAGQRCTTLRRLIVHKDIKADLMARLEKAYGSLKVGNPLEAGTLVGPLIDEGSFNAMQEALKQAKEQGGSILVGGTRGSVKGCDNGFYALPALVDMPSQSAVVAHETFAPILYVMTYDDLDAAIAMQNDVPQGLSSCIFTTDIREAEYFLSAGGSDCGIANVNIGPSGAEIGGAFGGEKETGGGRESGSDSWKIYMRRQTQTVNYSTELPLAQGVKFDVE